MAQTSLNSTGVASSGALSLQSNGTTEAIGISTGQVATLAQNPILTSGTANGVGYLNGSKVLTTGSALVFTGTNLGVGTASPNFESGTGQGIQVNYSGGLGSHIKLTDSASGSGATDGFDIYAYNTNGYVENYEAGAIIFRNNGSEGMRLTSTGLGIGTSSPNGKLNVAGAQNANLISLSDTSAIRWAWYLSSNALRLYNYATSSDAMTLDASGRLIVGGTSPATDAQLTISAEIEPTVFFQRAQAGNFDAAIQVSSGGAFIFKNGADSSTAAGLTERMRLDGSGNLLVGVTSQFSSGLICAAANLNNLYPISLKNLVAQGAGQSFLYFVNSAGNKAGSIDHTGTTTVAYTTSSDYRMKENIAPMTGALDTVSALNPVTYTWKEDGKAGQGFIAHELQAVVPDCVSGEKDAVDADGNPKYQGIDTSFLVATLTAAIQELNAKFEAYKATHP